MDTPSGGGADSRTRTACADGATSCASAPLVPPPLPDVAGPRNRRGTTRVWTVTLRSSPTPPTYARPGPGCGSVPGLLIAAQRLRSLGGVVHDPLRVSGVVPVRVLPRLVRRPARQMPQLGDVAAHVV